MSRAKYDAFYKEFFSQPQMVEGLLKNFVKGDWVNHLDFSTLKPFSSSFVSDGLKNRENDLILSIKCKDRDITAYIYLLFEFQSRIDSHMALRMLVYVGLFYQELIKRKLIRSGEPLPPVFPLVIYNGVRPWRAAQEVSQLIDTPFAELAAYLPRMRYFLFDISQVNVEDSRDPASFLVRLERVRDAEELRQIIEGLVQLLECPEYDHLRQRFTDFIREIALYRVSPAQPVPEFQDLKEITPMLAETVTRWTREWKKQGLMEGLKEGRKEGLMEGRKEGRKEGLMEGTLKGRAAALERLLRKRFGEIAPMYLEKIRNASIEQLDIWLERILDAKCIEDVFEP